MVRLQGLFQHYTKAIYLASPIFLALIAFPARGATISNANNILPLGSPNLTESRTSTQIAPGVIHRQILRGEQTNSDVYVVSAAFTDSLEAAQSLVNSLNSQGFEQFQPRIETINERALDDPEISPLGYLVRVGSFAEETEANNLLFQLADTSFSGLRVDYTGFDGKETTGPWAVNVLEVDLTQFEGKIVPALANEIIPGNEPLTSIATRTNALAAVNGGFFIIGETDGTPGDLAGISVIDGNLVSEAINGRTNLILSSDSELDASIATLVSQQTVISPDGAVRIIDGLNRQPGLIRSCGGVGGDLPTQEPKHDFTCTDSSELILFTPAFGETTEPGEGVEILLDASGEVIEEREQRGGLIPANGLILSGTGDAAEWLRSHAQLGTKVNVNASILAQGENLPITKALGIVNGGPRLLRDGAIEIPATAEGFHQPDNPEFYYRFGIRRNPRTFAGITAEEKLLLVTVDGRQPEWSVGASFTESAQILLSLGAVAGVNLDGGGSTAITIGNQLVNRPSDLSGERPIGDAIIITSPQQVSTPESDLPVGLFVFGLSSWLLKIKGAKSA